MDDDTDDLSAALSAAFEHDAAGGAAPAVAETPAGGEGEQAAPSTGPSRDEHGRFAKREGEQPAAQDAGTPESRNAGTTASQDDGPVEGWTPELWAAMTPEARRHAAEWATRQQQAVRERDERLKGYEPLDRVIGPKRDQLTARFGGPDRAIETLLHLADWADRDPVGFLSEQARMRGVSPQALLQAIGGNPNPGTGVAQQPVLSEQQQLQAFISQQVEARLTERAINQEYETFLREPNLEFRDDPGVKTLMASILQAGQATSYRQAYEMATQAHSTIGPKLRAAEAERAAKAAGQRRAEDARARAQAAVSVSGAPGTARPAQASGPYPRDLNALLADAFEKAEAGRV